MVEDQEGVKEEAEALRTYLVAAQDGGSAEEEYRALWLIRARRLRAAGRTSAADAAEQRAAAGRPAIRPPA